MIFYLTYNDLPSGIFSSQVIDVVKFFNTELNTRVRLIAFISIRNFFKNRSLLKKESTDAIVLPMFPGIHRWRYSLFLLRFISGLLKPSIIIGRSVIATNLALALKKSNGLKKVVYDGRGAIAAEWKEYNVVTQKKMLSEIEEIEKIAVLNSDYRVAVSNKLVSYWREKYNYTGNDHVIIPCTINNVFEKLQITENAIENSRKSLNLLNNDIVLVYSGSVAGWQSFDLLYQFLRPILNAIPNGKIVFLSEKDDNIKRLEREFPDKIFCTHVNPNQVPNLLIAADYGLLIRENTITNQVASPVKFAEYLACGLKVIISDNLGDYSQFVFDEKCGFLYFNNQPLFTITLDEKKQIRKIALSNFTKSNFKLHYSKLVD